jgi:hypothetical protein
MDNQPIENAYEIDWTDIPETSVREILRQAETYIDSTLKTAFAADQRATTLMGIYGAVGVALLVSAATLGTRAQPDLALIAAIIATGLCLLIGGVMCGTAGRPIDFYISGYEPEKIVKSSTDELWLLRYICEDLQRRIDLNKKILKKSSLLVLGSFLVALIAVPIGMAAFFFLRVMTLS